MLLEEEGLGRGWEPWQYQSVSQHFQALRFVDKDLCGYFCLAGGQERVAVRDAWDSMNRIYPIRQSLMDMDK